MRECTCFLQGSVQSRSLTDDAVDGHEVESAECEVHWPVAFSNKWQIRQLLTKCVVIHSVLGAKVALKAEIATPSFSSRVCMFIVQVVWIFSNASSTQFNPQATWYCRTVTCLTHCTHSLWGHIGRVHPHCLASLSLGISAGKSILDRFLAAVQNQCLR